MGLGRIESDRQRDEEDLKEYLSFIGLEEFRPHAKEILSELEDLKANDKSKYLQGHRTCVRCKRKYAADSMKGIIPSIEMRRFFPQGLYCIFCSGAYKMYGGKRGIGKAQRMFGGNHYAASGRGLALQAKDPLRERWSREMK